MGSQIGCPSVAQQFFPVRLEVGALSTQRPPHLVTATVPRAAHPHAVCPIRPGRHAPHHAMHRHTRGGCPPAAQDEAVTVSLDPDRLVPSLEHLVSPAMPPAIGLRRETVDLPQPRRHTIPVFPARGGMVSHNVIDVVDLWILLDDLSEKGWKARAAAQ